MAGTAAAAAPAPRPAAHGGVVASVPLPSYPPSVPRRGGAGRGAIGRPVFAASTAPHVVLGPALSVSSRPQRHQQQQQARLQRAPLRRLSNALNGAPLRCGRGVVARIAYSQVTAVAEPNRMGGTPVGLAWRGATQGADPAHGDNVVYTRFHWPADLGGKEVSVWGSFNNWAKGVKLHRFEDGSAFSVVLPLQPGTYEYKYVVDGDWLTALHEQTVYTSEGTNNFRTVAPTIEFSIAAPGARQVLVVGDWDGWQYSLLMQKEPDNSGVFTCQAHLPAGQYSYYYVVDDEVVLNPDEQYEVDEDRGAVHKDWSYQPEAFRVFYCTGWETALMHYRRLRPGQQPSDFYTLPMSTPSSRKVQMGMWKLGTVVPVDDGEVIEFYLSNGRPENDGLKEDRGSGGSLYKLPSPASFKLSSGRLRPFPRGAEERVMVVSDLDGTMFGDVNAHDAFDSSLRFQQYWNDNQALSGSVLVYNTGRSLGQFTGLLKHCGQRVAVPDALITAVGTKVWKRKGSDGLTWVEDAEFSARLDKCWDLGTARGVARDLAGHYNHDEGMIKVADDGSEHQHRLALIINKSIQAHVTRAMSEAFQRNGIEVRIIVSGAGSHRYVDVVPIAAGKEQALQYVRERYGVAHHLCVAAGDSGNDILMLDGDHPGIVVGNAQGELLRWLVKRPQDEKVLLAEAFYADGILEGLMRLGMY